MIRCGVFVLAGCNSILGLGDVTQRPVHDAQLFDAPIDAAPQCPPLGIAPTFRPAVHSLPFGACTFYSISESANRAMASCYEPSRGAFLAEGALEGELNQVATVDTAPSYLVTHMGADGDVLARVANHFEAAMPYFAVELQHRDAPLTWSDAGSLPYQALSADLTMIPTVTNPSAQPEPHIIVIDTPMSSPAQLREFAFTGTWQQVDTYDATTVSGYISNPSLTPDGLRMVFEATGGTHYSDRLSIHDRFRPEQAIVDIPQGLGSPVMSSNCGKLYFSALGTTLYLEQ